MNYSYYPRRPVKSFQDLEVYQKALACSVAVTKRLSTSSDNPLSPILQNLVLDVPLAIASAHSLRFAQPLTALNLLETVMLNCNKIVVLLEQYRDIYNNEIEVDFFDEQIKNILSNRMKILRLQLSWKKFMKGTNE